jgi:phosphate transport system ATP-binding protein
MPAQQPYDPNGPEPETRAFEPDGLPDALTDSHDTETVALSNPPVPRGRFGRRSKRRTAEPTGPLPTVLDWVGPPPQLTPPFSGQEYEQLLAEDPFDVRDQLFGQTLPGSLMADSITAWFGDHKVLDRVSLTMAAGEVTALIGPSGCGKSTFLRILNRMHEMIPTARLAGQVRLDNRDIYDPGERITAARRNIGMVFQKPNPFPAMSIYDNTVSGLKLAGIRANRSEKDILVEDSLRKASLWNEVKDRLDQPGGGLSGGQQQRLCIARSLAVSPRVLLMDEPCSALDPTSTRRVEETIESLKGQVTIVIVTHNMQQAARVSSQCAFFLAAENKPGVIIEHGDTAAMFNNPQDDRTNSYVNGQFG